MENESKRSCFSKLPGADRHPSAGEVPGRRTTMRKVEANLRPLGGTIVLRFPPAAVARMGGKLSPQLLVLTTSGTTNAQRKPDSLKREDECKSLSIRASPLGSAQPRGVGVGVVLGAACSLGNRRVSFNDGLGAGSGLPGRLGSLGPEERAGPGVSAHLLMAGIWGVIERGGEPGARMGLHEQLNVIRLRPLGSSWVIDNPAAFLPGSRLQTGGWLREGREGPRAGPRSRWRGVAAPSRARVGQRLAR